MNSLLDTIPAPPPPSELDELMMRSPELLAPADIDAIIVMQRQHRARLASGTKVKRTKATAEVASAPIDLAALGLIAEPSTPKPVPPSPKGMTRR